MTRPSIQPSRTADLSLCGRAICLFIWAVELSVSSCTNLDYLVFEYPQDGQEVDPTVVTANITYRNCGELPVYKAIRVSTEGTSVSYEDIDPAGLSLNERDIYGGTRQSTFEVTNLEGKTVTKGKVEQQSDDFSDIKLSLSLQPGKYKVALWQDFEDRDRRRFYSVDSPASIGIDSNELYSGSSDFKDASVNVAELDIPESGEWYKTLAFDEDLTRPVAKITFISSDGPLFIRKCSSILKTKSDIQEIKERFSINLSYDGYILTKYNAFSDAFTGSKTGYSFQGNLRETSNPAQLSVGSDYVFVDGETGTFWIQITVVLDETTTIMESPLFKVPVRRGCETIVTGDLLTMFLGQKVVVNPGFNGEFNFVD